MNKNEFNFAKWLTKKDIAKILDSVGLELLENSYNRNGELIKPVSKIKTDDDKCEFIVRCRYNEEKLKEIEKYKINNDSLLKSTKSMLLATSVAMSFFAGSYNSINGNDFLLKFEDFFCYELLSTKNEEDEIKFGRMLTKNYQDYMSKKFGSFYKTKRNSYYKKLNKLEKEEQNKADEIESRI